MEDDSRGMGWVITTNSNYISVPKSVSISVRKNGLSDVAYYNKHDPPKETGTRSETGIQPSP